MFQKQLNIPVAVAAVVFIHDVATYIHVAMQGVRGLDQLPRMPRIIDNNMLDEMPETYFQ